MPTNPNTKLNKLFFWGRPLSPLYSFLMSNRSSLYQNGIFKQHKLEVPVISVGNLVLGGTGKTPCVIYIAKQFQANGLKPAIISRGYGRESNDQIVVSDGSSMTSSVRMSGDEPRLIAERVPGIPVIVNADRNVAIQTAISDFASDLIILDDAFQHLKVKRDIDIIIIDGTNPWGNGFMLPSAARSNCMNTRFHISMKRSPSSSGEPGGPPSTSGP